MRNYLVCVVEKDNFTELKISIAKSAIEYVNDMGLESFKLTDLADKCGVTRSTLYRLFRDKGDVFIYAVSCIFDIIEKSYHEQIMNKDLSICDRLKNASEAIIAGVLDQKGIITGLIMYWYDSRGNQKIIQAELRKRFFIVHRLFYLQLKMAVLNEELSLSDIGMQTRILVTMITSLIIRSVLENNFTSHNSLKALILYIEGLKNENTSR